MSLARQSIIELNKTVTQAFTSWIDCCSNRIVVTVCQLFWLREEGKKGLWLKHLPIYLLISQPPSRRCFVHHCWWLMNDDVTVMWVWSVEEKNPKHMKSHLTVHTAATSAGIWFRLEQIRFNVICALQSLKSRWVTNEQKIRYGSICLQREHSL